MTGYLTPIEVYRETGVTRRQLHYWRVTGFLVPTKWTAGGRHARYSAADIQKVRLARRLLRHFSFYQIREIVPIVLEWVADEDHRVGRTAQQQQQSGSTGKTST